MNTKFWPTLVFGGIILGASAGYNVLRASTSAEMLAGYIIIIFAIVSVGYGFKLKGLSKKGVKEMAK